MALIERTQKTTDATAWRGEIPMSYVYTAGRAQGPFFEALRDEGRFIGKRCEKCGVTLCPLQMYCGRCFGPIEENTVEMPNRGVVHTFTVSWETFVRERKDEPSIVAMIRLDGTDGACSTAWVRWTLPMCTSGCPSKPSPSPKKSGRAACSISCTSGRRGRHRHRGSTANEYRQNSCRSR